MSIRSNNMKEYDEIYDMQRDNILDIWYMRLQEQNLLKEGRPCNTRFA